MISMPSTVLPAIHPPKPRRKPRGLPKHITIPNFNGYQVRIVRDGTEHSKSFPWSTHGKAAALEAAVAWRDTVIAKLPDPGNAKGGFRTKPLSHKSSWGRVGVVRTVSPDRRRDCNVHYVRYSVSWVDATGKARAKTFQVGRARDVTRAEEVHASLTAEAFRSEWEFCQRTGERFDPSVYDSWRKDRLYPFDPGTPRRAASQPAEPQDGARTTPAQSLDVTAIWLASVSGEANCAA